MLFTKELENQEALEGKDASLCCKTSCQDAKVTWRKGVVVLEEGLKYSMPKEGTTRTLVVHTLTVEDSGEYTCDTGDKQSRATLMVKGNHLFYFFPFSLTSFVLLLFLSDISLTHGLITIDLDSPPAEDLQSTH